MGTICGKPVSMHVNEKLSITKNESFSRALLGVIENILSFMPFSVETARFLMFLYLILSRDMAFVRRIRFFDAYCKQFIHAGCYLRRVVPRLVKRCGERHLLCRPYSHYI